MNRPLLLLAAALAAAPRAGADPAPTADPATGFAMPAAFKAPEPPGQRAAAMGAEAPAPGPWWPLFNDPVLDALEAQAVRANPDLHQAMERVLAARAQVDAARAGLLPQVAVPLSATREHTTNTSPVSTSRIVGSNAFFPSGSDVTFQGQVLENTFSDFQVPITVSYEIDVFGRLRHGRDQARALAEASKAERQGLELSLTAQVAATYFALRAADSAVAVLEHTTQLRRDAVAIQENRVKGGAASDVDLLRARVEAANTDADLVDAQQERTELENALAVLCGQPASTFRVAPHPLEQGVLPPVPAVIPTQLLTQRPDLVEAERRIAAASEGIKVARAKFYPAFSLQGGYGFESSQDNLLFEGQSHTWAIGGAINIPIFTGGRNTADLKSARARQEESIDAYRAAALGALREVENALSNLRSRAAQAEARHRAVADAQRVYDASQRSYGEGGLTYFEVIDAQRVLLGAELARVRTLGARYAATVDLIRAMGGSYLGSTAAP